MDRKLGTHFCVILQSQLRGRCCRTNKMEIKCSSVETFLSEGPFESAQFWVFRFWTALKYGGRDCAPQRWIYHILNTATVALFEIWIWSICKTLLLFCLDTMSWICLHLCKANESPLQAEKYCSTEVRGLVISKRLCKCCMSRSYRGFTLHPSVIQCQFLRSSSIDRQAR